MQRSPSVMKVLDVMSTDLVTSQLNEPLNEAVNRMLERDVGCIIVMNDSNVEGVITKGDVLKKAFLLGLDAREVSSKKVMSRPVVAIDPDSTLEQASRMMTGNNVSKLAVVKDKKLVGVVTSSDIIRAEPMQVGYLQELVKARFVPHDIA
ncbi:MAG TPA: CBS domain-containing protein [Nitrososphaerales archaeon]|nr:CBS domain-containing protein [Nitrososphaerales archaeon]